jgi:hypothetical protein
VGRPRAIFRTTAGEDYVDSAGGSGRDFDERHAALKRQHDKAEIMGSTAKETPEVRLNFVSPEYFSVLRIPLNAGRLWERTETMRGAALAVVNESMARRSWPKGSAIGQAVRFPNMKDSPPY